MFINSTQLKKLMKRDYKDVKLTIGNVDGGYSIMGSAWMVHIAHDGMPNIVKSLIIELAGILPGKGEILQFQSRIRILSMRSIQGKGGAFTSSSVIRLPVVRRFAHVYTRNIMKNCMDSFSPISADRSVTSGKSCWI